MMNGMNNTARNFALQLGALAALYLSLSFLLVLLFNVINLSILDDSEYYYQVDSYASSVRLGFAMVIVFFPTYLVLQRMVNKYRRADANGSYLTLTKWLLYLSLLVGGGVLLGDLVAVIMAFLEGEVTERFIFKAAAVLVVVGAAFHYYLLDARGYWMKREQGSIMYAIGAIILVLVSLGYGVVNIDSPAEVREKRLDERQRTDLQDIEYRIVEYYEREKALPASLEDVYTTGNPVPTAPDDRPGYEYKIGENGYSLCATFANPNPNMEFSARPQIPSETDRFFGMYSWEHPAGYYCFERTKNPDYETTLRAIENSL